MKLGLIAGSITVIVGILLVSCAFSGPSSTKMAKIGVLLLAPSSPPFLNAFRQGLRDVGYTEGENIALEIRHAGGQEAALPDRAAELVQLKVDIIVAAGDAAVRAAKQATHTIPIVMLINGDPVGSGLVASFQRPGANITGITGLSARLSARRLEFLNQVVPTLSHVAILFNPDDETKAIDQQQLQVTARALGIRLSPAEVRDPEAFEQAFRTIVQEHADGLVVFGTAFTFFYRAQIVRLAAENRLPTIYESKQVVENGGLMSYGASVPDMLRRVATYVDKILKGAKPGKLPVLQVTKFELAVNLQTANILGLTIPSSMLSRANQVIQ